MAYRDLTLRERDHEGDLYKIGKVCSVRVVPQFADLNYQDGNTLTLQYAEGPLVRCSTTWADSANEVEGRMFDVLKATLDTVRGHFSTVDTGKINGIIDE